VPLIKFEIEFFILRIKFERRKISSFF
jgi:hypothetical protein